MDWTTHFPAFANSQDSVAKTLVMEKQVEVADVGCGFGGLLVALSPCFPETLMLGMLRGLAKLAHG
jgi:tRNA (guanine-N7-)-methyltransferase